MSTAPSTFFDIREETQDASLGSFVDELEQTTAAMKFKTSWFGNQRKVTDAQKITAASTFNADAQYVSMSKKLLDNKDPAWKKLVKIRGSMEELWKRHTIPYPEPGIRLMKRDKIGNFDQQFFEYQQKLYSAEQEFDIRLPEIIEQQRQRLGRLFNREDYPDTIVGACKIECYPVSITAPDYLKSINPALYQQAVARIKASFEESLLMTEQAFAADLSQMIDHAVERLSGSEDGTPKIFRDSIINNLKDFFERFNDLNTGSSKELEKIVADAKRIVESTNPEDLRKSKNIREIICTKLAPVNAALDGFMVNRSSRNLIDLPSMSV